MRTIVFATNNAHKLREVRAMVPATITIMSLADLDFHDELAETSATIEGNALQKARFIKTKFGYDCFADDTALEVDALDGAPGIYSARYAGPACDSQANMRKLMDALQEEQNRSAHFRTVIALIVGEHEHLFEGVVHGHITEKLKGTAGFGYDPIFVPENGERTYAEMSDHEKNHISHRAQAVKKLTHFLSQEKTN